MTADAVQERFDFLPAYVVPQPTRDLDALFAMLRADPWSDVLRRMHAVAGHGNLPASGTWPDVNPHHLFRGCQDPETGRTWGETPTRRARKG